MPQDKNRTIRKVNNTGKTIYQSTYGVKFEGRAEGQAENSLAIARKMKNAGRPFSEIAEFTDLSIETVEQL